MTSKNKNPQVRFELHDAARLMRRNFDRRAKAHGLSRSRWQVLWHLAKEEGQNQASLADRMNVAPISLARQLDKLEKEQLVERRRDDGDRRCFRLFLTPRAEPALALLRQLAEQTRAEALQGITDEEMGQLQRILQKMVANLSAAEANHELA